jgi:formiminotetrahydrofolate cyclodeaminase
MKEHINEGVREYVSELASSAATPGGGNAAGLLCAFSASLMLMSLRIALIKKQPEDENWKILEDELEQIRIRGMELADEDSRCFRGLLEAWRDPSKDNEAAYSSCASVSLDIASSSLDILRHAESLDMKLFKNIITDVYMASEFAAASFRGAVMNCRVNLKYIKDESVIRETVARQSSLEKEFGIISRDLEGRVEEVMSS